MFKRKQVDILKLKDTIRKFYPVMTKRELRAYLLSIGFSYPTIQKYIEDFEQTDAQAKETKRKLDEAGIKFAEIERLIS